MSKYSIGIDPGLSGAIAILSPENLKIFDMPTMTVERNGKAKRQVSAAELAEMLYLYSGRDCHVYCERVGAVRAGDDPGQVEYPHVLEWAHCFPPLAGVAGYAG